MQANFYHNIKDERYADKKLGEPIYSDIDIEILEPNSIEEPRLKVSTGLIGQNVNYLYLTDLERYYFIRSWSMMNGHVVLDCEEDYLCSHIIDLKKNKVLVRRNTNKYNLYLDDGKYKVQNRTAIMTKEFPSGFGANKYLVMGVVGKGQSE